jgi:hypothetical protein
VAPLRRKTTGAFTPETPWLHYAGNPVAPLRRKRNGAYMPEIHNIANVLNSDAGRNAIRVADLDIVVGGSLLRSFSAEKLFLHAHVSAALA